MKKITLLPLLIFSVLVLYAQSSGFNPTYKWLKTQGELEEGAPVGNLSFRALHSSGQLEGAAVRVIAADNPMSNFLAMDMSFETGTESLRERLRIEADGTIGVNTEAPTARLEVFQPFNDNIPSNTLFQVTGGIDGKPGVFSIAHNQANDELLQATLEGDFAVNKGDIVVSDKDVLVSSGQLFVNTEKVPGDYVAFFNGSVIATEFWVKEYANWPDYVFTSNYDLMSLSEIDAYIKKYGHLPNMPSAAEIASGGFSLDVMLAKSIEKTEELTLHMIAIEKYYLQETARLKAQVDLLLERLEKLENQ